MTREPMPYGKVLVVDDMKSNLDVATLLLNPYQLNIDTAESGVEAVDLIKSGRAYDIIFMDHMMPGMDGIETANNIRGFGYKDPIIALTANAAAEQREIFLANGFDDFISKPINIRQLDDILNRFIRDRERGQNEEIDMPVSAENSGDAGSPAFEIPGLNTEAGLALYGGDLDIYLSVLRSYAPNAADVTERLRNVSRETLSDYAINVHGLKGISAGVAADELKEAAYDLEMKAKSGDLEGVLAGNEALLKKAEEVVSAVRDRLLLLDRENPKPLLPCPDPKLLARMKESCKAFDMNEIDDIMDELESADYEEDGDLVTWLRERVDDLDFAALGSRLSELLE